MGSFRAVNEKRISSRSGKRVDKKELAEILGVTPRQVVDYSNAGMPTLGREGRRNFYDTAQVIIWLRRRDQEKVKPVDGGDNEARLLAAKAGMAELKLKQEQCKLVELEEVGHWLSELLEAIKARIQGLGTSLRVRLPELAAAQYQNVFNEISEGLLNELCQTFDTFGAGSSEVLETETGS